jgi:hypothetical protein
LVKLDPLVNTIVEDVIYWHLRSEDPKYTTLPPLHSTTAHLHSSFVCSRLLKWLSYKKPEDEIPMGYERFYVDAFKLSRVLYHLILSVNLTDSYTLFVMNPKKPVGPNQSYGYRYSMLARAC